MTGHLDLGLDGDLPPEVAVLAAEYGIVPFRPPVYREAVAVAREQETVCTLCGVPVAQMTAHTEWHHLVWTAMTVPRT